MTPEPLVKPSEVLPLLDPLLILVYIPFPGFQVSGNPENGENRQKPETKLPYC
jgi:hypothetical protein